MHQISSWSMHLSIIHNNMQTKRWQILHYFLVTRNLFPLIYLIVKSSLLRIHSFGRILNYVLLLKEWLCQHLPLKFFFKASQNHSFGNILNRIYLVKPILCMNFLSNLSDWNLLSLWKYSVAPKTLSFSDSFFYFSNVRKNFF